MHLHHIHLIIIITFFAVLISGCSDTSGGSTGTEPPETQDVTKAIDITFAGETVAEAELYLAADSSLLGSGRFSLTRESGTTLDAYTTAAGYKKQSVSIPFSDGDVFTIELEKTDEPEPETAAITANLLLDGAAYRGDATVINASTDEALAEQPDEDGQLAITRPVGTELAIRIEGEDIETQTETLVFDDSKTLDIALTPKEVEPETSVLTITPEIGDFDARTRSRGDDFTHFEVTVAGETYTNESPGGALLQEGESFDVELPTGSAVDVSGRFVYEQESRSQEFGRHRSLATGEESVTLDGDTSLELALAHQPACSDNINNDDSDNAVDENDSGCVDGFTSRDPSSPDFEYEPEDDSEVLAGVKQSLNLGTSDKAFVSSKEGQRENPIVGHTFPESALSAVGKINGSIKNRVETGQKNEAFGLIITCGPEEEGRLNHDNPRTTDIIPDDQSVDGFRNSPINRITREWLSDGRDCYVKAVHASKIRGEGTGDGNDDVFFASPNEAGGIGFSWFYEPEEVQ